MADGKPQQNSYFCYQTEVFFSFIKAKTLLDTWHAHQPPSLLLQHISVAFCCITGADISPLDQDK